MQLKTLEKEARRYRDLRPWIPKTEGVVLFFPREGMGWRAELELEGGIKCELGTIAIDNNGNCWELRRGKTPEDAPRWESLTNLRDHRKGGAHNAA
ncbi:MAG: hypothetical protein LAT65_05735 [Saccharospirillum sp.]|nr:hypothetical protein [Saccharospirillum sp.]